MSEQKENSHLAVKLELRRRIARRLDRPLRALDCCAAKGTIWGRLAQEFEIETYLPVDLKPQLPGTLKMDSRKAVEVLDLAEFNVIDVDTFGEPWEHWLRIARRIGFGPTAVFLTHGHITLGRGGTTSRVARKCMGIPPKWKIPNHPALQTFAASYCLTRGCENLLIQKAIRWTSVRVDYYGLLVGIKAVKK